MSAIAVSIAECEGATDCDVQLLSDSACETAIQYTEYGNYTSFLGYIPYFTPDPPIMFVASSCGRSFANFYNSSWGLVHTSTFTNVSATECVLVNSTVPPNLVFVLSLAGIDRNETVLIKRSPPTDTVFFSRLVSSVGYESGNAVIDVQLTPTYRYPWCCTFPESFVSDAFQFNRLTGTSTCGIDDVVTYRIISDQPSSVTALNASFDEWTFVFANPLNETCGLVSAGNELTDPFIAVVVVPVVVPPTPPDVNAPSTGVIVGATIAIVLPLLIVLGFLVALKFKQKTVPESVQTKVKGVEAKTRREMIEDQYNQLSQYRNSTLNTNT